MSLSKWFFLTGIVLFLSSLFLKKKQGKYSTIVLIISIFTFIVPFFLPRQMFGKWDATKFLKGKDVNSIQQATTTAFL